jgi:hypothetical protein
MSYHKGGILLMLEVDLRFKYNNKEYCVVDKNDKIDRYDLDALDYYYMSGPMSCDCVRSNLIRQQCDVSFPIMPFINIRC